MPYSAPLATPYPTWALRLFGCCGLVAGGENLVYQRQRLRALGGAHVGEDLHDLLANGGILTGIGAVGAWLVLAIVARDVGMHDVFLCL